MEILCSACLLGIKCRFDWVSKANKEILELLKDHTLIPICPEQLGGLSTPRHPAEIIATKPFKIVDKYWNDVSAQFLRWAWETLKIATTLWITHAVMKQRSPSCGCWEIYDGTFGWNIIKWDWLTTTLLKLHKIKVVSEENIQKLFK